MTDTASKKYDIIIAGGGAAGLSLAYKLSCSTLADLKILIIDKTDKTDNDRTWSFWCLNEDIFPEIIYKTWNRIKIKTSSSENIMDISPYKYQMIRGIDFYNHVKSKLSTKTNFKFVQEEIIDIQDGENEAVINTTENSYLADVVFSSIPKPIPHNISRKRNFLLQHFKGYIIETPHKAFDEDLVCFMDFNVPQKMEARFGYVLPFNENTALVEFTIFSDNILEGPEYTLLLKDYISQNLKIQDYKIFEEEFGIIPMTDIAFEKRAGKKIFNIGSRGGLTKASTGYTFKRIQEECDHIINDLERNYPELTLKPLKKRFRLYDSILLHVLAGNLYPADEVFSQLFIRNSPLKILKFLEEKTNILEELKILLSLPSFPFMKGAYRALFKKGTKKNRAKISIQQYLRK